MTLRNDDLAERFVRGGDTGSASRMDLLATDEVRYVLGYGWAVYAAATPDHYYLFGDGYKSDRTNVGWAGYSGTTTKHLQVLKAALDEHAEAYAVVGTRLEEDSLLAVESGSKTEFLRELEEANGVEKRGYTGYYYRKDE